MARWASFIDGKRKEGPVLLLDAGDFCHERKPETGDLEYRYFFEGMKRMEYDAVGVAENEIRFGRTQLLKAAGDFGLPLVSTNIMDKRGKGTVGSKWIIKDLGGGKSPFGGDAGVRVGIFSVTLPMFIFNIDAAIPKYYSVIDPKTAALQAVSELKAKGCDVIVAMSFQGWNNTMDFASSVPGVDIVINGGRSHEGTHSESTDSTFVVDTGNLKKSFTEVRVVFRNGRKVINAIDVGGAAHAAEERADLADLEKQYQMEVAARKKKGG